jgi:hypothetical protein
MFGAINIDPADNLNLSTEDQTFCLKVQEDFDLIMENLKDYQALFSALEKQDRFPESLNVLWPALAFLPAPVISDINERRQDAIKAFTDHILDHFSKRYNLKETDKLIIPQKPTITYKDVVSKVISKFGNLDSAGETFLIKEFQTKIIVWKDQNKLENSKIAFSNVFYYNTYYSFPYDIDHSKIEKIETVIKAISFFETGQITNIIPTIAKELPNREERSIGFDSVYELSGLKKVKGVKFFKNGRLDILFYSRALAEEFFNLFGIKDEDKF